MVSIVLHDFGSCEQNWNILKELWKKILMEDTSWHFFWEGKNTVIRCQKDTAQAVIDWLRGVDIGTSIEGEWIDNIYVTKKYQKEFTQIFHAYSELAMKVESSDLYAMLDRICHCFLNVMIETEEVNMFIGSIRPSTIQKYWESLLLSMIATVRAGL